VLSGSRPVAESVLASHEVTAPCRVSNLITLAPVLVERSPLALSLFGWAPGFLRPRPLGKLK
jgi:hypothetical protein